MLASIPSGRFVLGQAKVVIDDIYGHRETLCPTIAAGPLAARIISRAWRWFLKKLGYYAALIAMAAWLGQAAPGAEIGPQHVPFIVGAISSAIATSWKAELGRAIHDFTISTGATVRTALYTSSATLGASTTAYSATNELPTAGGYTAGGQSHANATPTTSGTVAIYDWADPTWTSATWSTANGALTYNDTASGNPAIFVTAFGSDQSVTAGTFVIELPTADASNAIIRIT